MVHDSLAESTTRHTSGTCCLARHSAAITGSGQSQSVRVHAVVNFRSHVAGRASNGLSVKAGVRALAKVRDHDDARLAHQHVIRLQVAVDDAEAKSGCSQLMIRVLIWLRIDLCKNVSSNGNHRYRTHCYFITELLHRFSRRANLLN